MKKVLVVFGTRPEIIKLAPVIQKLELSDFEVIKLHTSQHGTLADSMLSLFRIEPDIRFKIDDTNGNLNALTKQLIPKLEKAYSEINPDCVIVQGDTTTAFLGALAASNIGIPVGHVEAGLRSFDIHNPYPEELNRKQISGIADFHFSPTEIATHNLLDEEINQDSVFETGNTVIDALYEMKKTDTFKKAAPEIFNRISDDQKLILVTAHRRENHGEPLIRIMEALVEIVHQIENTVIIFPAHPSSFVQETVHQARFKHERIIISPAIDYLPFHHCMERADLILTDSGGIQEEAASLGKRMLVLREKTERQELIESGFTKLVGSDTKKIFSESIRLLNSDKDVSGFNPYGDGTASQKIVEVLKNQL